MPSPPRRPSLLGALRAFGLWLSLSGLSLLCATPAAAAPAAPAAHAADAPVRGLIVRLRNAPPHDRLLALSPLNDRERALAAGEADAESRRWRRVLREAALDGSAPAAQVAPSRMRPVGRDQQLLAFDRPLDAAAARRVIAQLKARPDVEWVEINTRERRLQVPTDPFFANASQWWLLPRAGSDANVLTDRRRGAADFQSAWMQVGGTGTEAARVAVLDTGITAHPDLAGRTLPGYDFVSDSKFAGDGNGRDNDPSDPGDFVSSADLGDSHFNGCALANSSWHGTVIAGMVAAGTNNGQGVAAINWNGRVLPVRVAGKCGADVADIVDGMRWAAGLTVAGVATVNPNPARIINISFGGDAACGSAYQTAIDELKSLGVVVIAAAGNEHGHPTRPASCSGAVGVVGLNKDGFKSHYSNFGNQLTASGIAVASGDDSGDSSGARWNTLADAGILSTHNSGLQGPGSAQYSYLWGTSFAAPQVAGAVSLMLSVNASLSYDQIIDGLKKSARPHVSSPVIGTCSWNNPGRCICTTTTCGAGILDAAQALLYAANPTTYVPPARTGEVIDNADVRAAAALGADRPANTGSPNPPVDNGGGNDDDDDSGGGTMSWPWLVALLLAAGVLRAGMRGTRHTN